MDQDPTELPNFPDIFKGLAKPNNWFNKKSIATHKNSVNLHLAPFLTKIVTCQKGVLSALFIHLAEPALPR